MLFKFCNNIIRMSSQKYIPPHLREKKQSPQKSTTAKPPSGKSGKYIPPSKRRQMDGSLRT